MRGLLVAAAALAACAAGPLDRERLRGTLGGECPFGSVDCGGDLCWPPGTDCSSVGACPGGDSCQACAGGGEAVSWCIGGALVCCPVGAPLMCGDGVCAGVASACPGGEVAAPSLPCD